MEADQSSSHINNNDGKRVKRHGDNDRFSVLPDDLLLDILKSVDLRTAVRTGALARRWRHLPYLLPDLVIDVTSMMPRHRRWDLSPDRIMTTYTKAITVLLLSTQPRRIRSLSLAFYLIDPYLRSIGDAVAATTADSLEFSVHGVGSGRDDHQVDHGERFIRFLTACPVVFARLTSLTLYDLCFSATLEFVADLLNACNQLELLSLNRCEAFDIEIDAPSCSLLSLEIHACYFKRLMLTRVPKLERVLCDVDTQLRSIRFGYVPCLRAISLSAENLIYGENPRQLSPAFHNLRNVSFFNLDSPDMAWILFVLEAAPFLNSLYIQLSPRLPTTGTYRANKAEETPKFEHRNLRFLQVEAYGISKDVMVLHYTRLITEVAVSLKKIHLLEQCEYRNCDVTCLCQVNESWERILRDIVATGFSSSIDITIEPVTRHTSASS